VRILSLVTDGFGGQGGIALHCRHLLGALCAIASVRTVHALPRIKPEYVEAMPEKLEYLDCSANSPFAYFKTLIKESIVAGRWNLVVCEHMNLLPVAAIVATLHRAKLLLVIHGFESWNRPSFSSQLALRQVDQVLSVSEVTKKRFLNWSGLKPSVVTVIPNAIDTDLFSPGPRPDYLQRRYGLKNQSVIMTLGRLSDQERSKGFDLVISAMTDLLVKTPNLRYLIIGGGDDQNRLKKLTQVNGVSSRVIFTGEISDSEKVDHYRLADAYIMPSRLEGFGYVYLEAMACGLPVVGSKLDGGRDALLNGMLGELVDPDDRNELCGAIMRALEKPKSVPKQLSQFSLPNFNQAVESLVDKVIRSGD
jgi:glycosyltransferase involved in cell wall biosynthesis